MEKGCFTTLNLDLSSDALTPRRATTTSLQATTTVPVCSSTFAAFAMGLVWPREPAIAMATCWMRSVCVVAGVWKMWTATACATLKMVAWTLDACNYLEPNTTECDFCSCAEGVAEGTGLVLETFATDVEGGLTCYHLFLRGRLSRRRVDRGVWQGWCAFGHHDHGNMVPKRRKSLRFAFDLWRRRTRFVVARKSDDVGGVRGRRRLAVQRRGGRRLDH